jgi:DNA-binding NarL/FixJ family response regulator
VVADTIGDYPDMEVVGQVGSLAEGMELFSQHKPDVVFIDVHLPDGYGTSFITTIKEERPHTQVVAMSNYTLMFRKACIQGGADYFFAKQSGMGSLRDIIASVRKHVTPRQAVA